MRVIVELELPHEYDEVSIYNLVQKSMPYNTVVSILITDDEVVEERKLH